VAHGWARGEGEVGGKARRGHGALIKAPLTDGDRARRSAVSRNAGILHWGGSTLRKRNNQQTGERHERFGRARASFHLFVRDMGRSDLPLPAKLLAAPDMRVPRCLHMP
jgi:hypothetical protein